MARRYAEPMLNQVAEGVAREIAARCPWCSKGVAENLCRLCSEKFVRQMDHIALEGSKKFLEVELPRFQEHLTTNCDVCYGDGKIHEPWGDKMDWSSMVICADPAIGLRLGEVVCVSRQRHRWHRFWTKFHNNFGEACGTTPDAVVDLGAHPQDGERWECALDFFDSVAFFHVDMILATAVVRPNEAVPMHANHAWGRMPRIAPFAARDWVTISLEEPDLTDSGGGVAAVTAAKRRMHVVVASGVEGVVPGNSVVILDRGAVLGSEIQCEIGGRYAQVHRDYLLCKGEIVP